MATRKASGIVLEKLVPKIPELMGGSADLSGSNNTKVSGSKAISKDDIDGNYINYGPREFAMAAVMNGLALHKGFIPYGSTFLIFSDYCKPAMRLSALMGTRAIYVMTHDSIFLGEDGPTHQPIEQLPSLRSIPNLLVMRPADAVETAECWELSLMAKKMPSVLVLTRQGVPTLRTEHVKENLCTLGAYIISPSSKEKRDITLVATGSEVSLAMDVQIALQGRGYSVAVVSAPCWKLFNDQSPEYRESVLGDGNVFKVVIEAAFPMGWRNYIGGNGMMIAMRDFGLSAPAGDLRKHFGFTAENIVEKIEERLK